MCCLFFRTTNTVLIPIMFDFGYELFINDCDMLASSVVELHRML